MHGIAAGAARNVYELINAKIAFAGRRRTNGVGFIGEADVERFAIDVAEDRDGADIQLATGAQDAHGDFTAISDYNFLEHEKVKRDGRLSWREACSTNLPG